MPEVTNEVINLFGSEFWAAIVGAVVGGIITYLLQRQALREARSARKEARDEEDKAVAYSLLFKTLAIWNNLAHLKNYIDEAKALQTKFGADRLSMVLKPLANLGDAIKYDPREMSLLLGLDELETLNKVLSLDTIHNSILPVWALYASKRDELHNAALTHGIDLNSGIGSISLPSDSRAARLYYEVDALAEDLAASASRDEADANDAREALLASLKKKIGVEIGFEVRN